VVCSGQWTDWPAGRWQSGGPVVWQVSNSLEAWAGGGLECWVGGRCPGGPAGQGLVGLLGGGPVGQRLVALCGWLPTWSFSISWHGEVFHGLGVQGAKVSALSGALPQPSVSPAS
jgi:hypothetical protein